MLGVKQKAQIQSQRHYFQKPSQFWIKLCGCKFFRTRAVVCLLGLYSQMLRNDNKKQNTRLSALPHLIYITWTPSITKILNLHGDKKRRWKYLGNSSDIGKQHHFRKQSYSNCRQSQWQHLFPHPQAFDHPVVSHGEISSLVLGGRGEVGGQWGWAEEVVFKSNHVSRVHKLLENSYRRTTRKKREWVTTTGKIYGPVTL